MIRNLSFVVVLSAGILFPTIALAATMGVSASPITVTEGDIVTARVLVNPGGTAINNAEAVLRYPVGTLQALSVSKSGSLFSLWVEEPTISASAGTVSFNGGVPNPGVSSSGTAVSVTFKALKSGVAVLSLSGAAIRANDGLGTNVLTSSSGAQVTIVAALQAPPTPAPISTPAPTKPAVVSGPVTITSLTHPSTISWYQDRDPAFSWALPTGVTGVQLGITESVTEAPTVSYTKPITNKTIEDLEDGTWYFRMRYKSGGVWSAISTYTVHIDGTAPTFATLEALYDENDNAVLVTARPESDVSGIVGYEVILDEGKPKQFNPQDIEGGGVRIPIHSSGLHSLTVTLIDAAGNRTSEERTFSAPPTLLNQTLFQIGPWGVNLLVVLLGLAFVSLLSIVIALFGWITRRGYRSRTPLPVVRKSMHRAFLKIKENMEKDVRALDKARTKRELSKEEVALYRRLLENLTKLEKYLDHILEDAE